MTRTARSVPPRRRGRPPDAADSRVREALLDSARTLFLRYGFRAVSSRQIAAAAGVNPAMIHYYFGDKEGLYRAMYEAAAMPVFSRVAAMFTDPGSVDVEGLARAQMRMLAANPWIPGLIVREVLASDGTFRQTFVRDFASKYLPMLRTVIAREIEEGGLRRDLDPSLTMVALASLTLFPFISLPITTRVLGIDGSERGAERLIAHTLRIFLRGVAVEKEAHA